MKKRQRTRSCRRSPKAASIRVQPKGRTLRRKNWSGRPAVRRGVRRRPVAGKVVGPTAMAWIRDRALTVVLMAMFLLFLAGQLLTGFAEYNSEQSQHQQATVSLPGYLVTGHLWEALFENWESEFLQMAVFVLLTTVLIQRGSPESRRPGVKELYDADPRDFVGSPDAPWPVRRGGWIL